MQTLSPFLADSPVGAALPNLPTPATVSTTTVPAAFATLRLDPKTRATLALEKAKADEALQKQQQLEVLKEQLAANRQQALLQQLPQLLGETGGSGVATSPSGLDPGAGTAPSAPALPTGPGSPALQLDTALAAKARQYGVTPALALAILGNEGSGDTSISPKGAASRWQVMPETARKYLPQAMQGQSAAQIQQALTTWPTLADHVALAHLRDLEQQFPGRPDLVAAAYFSGAGNIKDGQIVDPQRRALDANGQPFGPSVQQYVDAFQQRYQGQPVRRGAGTAPSTPVTPMSASTAPSTPVPSSAGLDPQLQALSADQRKTYLANQVQMAQLTTARDRYARAAQYVATQPGGPALATQLMQTAQLYQSRITPLETANRTMLETAQRQRFEEAHSSDPNEVLAFTTFDKPYSALHLDERRQVLRLRREQVVQDKENALKIAVRTRQEEKLDAPLPAEKLNLYFDTTTGERLSDPLTSMRDIQANKATIKAVTKKQAEDIDSKDAALLQGDNILRLTQELTAPGGPLAALSGRTDAAIRVAVTNLLQTDDRVRTLGQWLVDYNLKASRALEGGGSRIGQKMLEKSAELMPQLLAQLGAEMDRIHIGWGHFGPILVGSVKVGGGRAPDLPSTIVGQIGANQELILHGREQILYGREQARVRADQRRQAREDYRQQWLTTLQDQAPTPGPTPAGETPTQQGLREFLPQVWQTFTP
jgi:Transglycosylase SLT domain